MNVNLFCFSLEFFLHKCFKLNNFVPDLVDPLEKCVERTVSSLIGGGIYDPNLVRYSYRDGFLKIFNANQRGGISYMGDELDQIFHSGEVMAVKFYNLGFDSSLGLCVRDFSGMLYNRVLMEIARGVPHPRFKNSIYKVMGVNMPDPDGVIVAPRVFMDYICPELITIERGVFIGEDAMVLSHSFDSTGFVIGKVHIKGGVNEGQVDERRTLVGARAMIWPGTVIGRGAQIGSNAVVGRGYVPDGEKVKAGSFYVGRK